MEATQRVASSKIKAEPASGKCPHDSICSSSTKLVARGRLGPVPPKQACFGCTGLGPHKHTHNKLRGAGQSQRVVPAAAREIRPCSSSSAALQATALRAAESRSEETQLCSTHLQSTAARRTRAREHRAYAIDAPSASSAPRTPWRASSPQPRRRPPTRGPPRPCSTRSI